jgi:beta-galactosidase
MKRLLVSLLALVLVAPAAAAQTPARYRAFLFGADYYPEHWPESYWDRDAQRMQAAGANVVRVGEFAWYLMEPKEGTYDFSLFDRAIETLGRHGVKTILGTPTATPPKWLTDKYPETLRVNAEGRADDDQSRRHYCYNSPTYRELSRKVVDAMVRHFRDNPNVIGWQVDNEFNNESRDCYSESCRRAFRVWLRAKYGSLDALNERWGTQVWSQWYTDWRQVDVPWPTPAFHNPALILDYKRFVSDSVGSYAREQVEIIRRHEPDEFITTNGIFKNIDYWDFGKNFDIYAYDNYPTFSESPQYGTGAALTLCRGVSGRMMIMEQLIGPAGQTYLLRTPSPEQVRLWTFQTIAHGADGVVHFRWRGARKGAEEYWFGVLDQDDVPRGRYENFKLEGQQLARIGPEVLGSRVVSDVAVIKDFEDEWVYDHQYFTDEVRVGGAYTSLFQAASELKYNVDIVGPEADYSAYKIVFAPYKVIMDANIAKKARAFVEAGGVLVVGAHTAVKNRDNAMTDETMPILVRDLFGAEIDTFSCYQPPSREKNALRFSASSAVPVHVFADVLVPKGARTIATWDRDFFRGAAACTENAVGRGKAVYYGSFFNLEAARELLGRYAREKGLRPILTGAPRELEVTRRVKGGASYTFVLNHAEKPVTVPLGPGYTDLIAGRPAAASLTLKAYEYRVLKKTN